MSAHTCSIGGRIEFVHTGHSSKSFKPASDDNATLASDVDHGLLVESTSSLIPPSASERPSSPQSDSGTTVTMLLPGAIVKAPFKFGSIKREHPTTPLLPHDQLHYLNLVRRSWKDHHTKF